MRAELLAASLCALVAWPAVARGELEAASPSEPESTDAVTGTHAVTGSTAVGLSAGWLRRNDYGDRTRGALAIELVGLSYRQTARDRLFYRPGVRLGYVGLAPAEMPSSLRFVERDVMLAGELGAVFDGVVIPAAALGAGLTVRRLALDVRSPIETEDDPLSRWELLPVAYAHVGAGVPFARGLLVLEPFARLELVAGDRRALWRSGIDMTFALR
jgi:hypothetical protein